VKRIHACLMTLMVVSTTVALAQQPAADVAQKAKPKKASRVITDDDFPQRSTDTSPATPAEIDKSSTSDKMPAMDTKPDSVAKKSTDKKSGDSALEALQSRLQELESDETNLTNGNKKLEEDIANEEADSRREILQSMLANRKRSLERTKSEHSDIAQQIVALKKKN
jgi:hypothetical protein